MSVTPPSTHVDLPTLPVWACWPGVLLELVPIVDAHFYVPAMRRAEREAEAEIQELVAFASQRDLAGWLAKHGPGTVGGEPTDPDEIVDAWEQAVGLVAIDARDELVTHLRVVALARRCRGLAEAARAGASSPTAALGCLRSSLAAGEVSVELAACWRALLGWCRGDHPFQRLQDLDGRVEVVRCD